MKKMTFRHKARELALQILFQREFLGDINVETSLAYFRTTVKEPEEVWAYCEKLLRGVLAQLPEIDVYIGKQSAHWSLERMALVDLNILRVATFELLLAKETVPHQVVIDEAVEIAKKYSTTDSGGFINGVLDQIFKTGV